MKIALVYDRFYPEDIGGAEKRNWEIARRLVRKGHEVWVVSMQRWPGEPVMVREGVHCAGVAPAVPTFLPSGRRSIIEPLYFAWHFFRFLRHHGFDLIDCANFPYLPCYVAKGFSRGRRTPLVVTWHEARGLKGWWSYSGWAGLFAWIFEIGTARLTPHNLSVSPLTVERAGRIFRSLKGQIKFVPTGIEVHPGKAERKPSLTDRFQLLYLGRLVAHKRVEWILEAARALAPEFPELKVVIIGKGPLEAGLKRQAKAMGLQRQVQFKGFVSDEALEAEMDRSGLLLLPSQQEGLGLVILEAMAIGLPVVAADAPLSAARTIMDPGRDGLLVRTCDDMIAAIRRVWRDPVLYERLVKGAAATGRRYDWDSVIIPELETYYQQLITASGSAGNVARG